MSVAGQGALAYNCDWARSNDNGEFYYNRQWLSFSCSHADDRALEPARQRERSRLAPGVTISVTRLSSALAGGQITLLNGIIEFLIVNWIAG